MSRGPSTRRGRIRPPVGSGASRRTGPLADAVVLLRAAGVGAWTADDPWPNEGTGGATFDAAVGDITPVLAGGKFTVDDDSADLVRYGFEIADDDLWSPTIGTDGLTIAHDWTPLETPSSKAYWHYDGSDLQTAGAGFVSEELDYGDPYQFYVWSANDQGPGNPATIGVPVAPAEFGTRRIDVARIDGNTLTVFRDGVSAGTFDLTGRGPITEAAALKLGQPCEHYAFAAWDRALTDAEVAALTPGLA